MLMRNFQAGIPELWRQWLRVAADHTVWSIGHRLPVSGFEAGCMDSCRRENAIGDFDYR